MHDKQSFFHSSAGPASCTACTSSLRAIRRRDKPRSLKRITGRSAFFLAPPTDDTSFNPCPLECSRRPLRSFQLNRKTNGHGIARNPVHDQRTCAPGPAGSSTKGRLMCAELTDSILEVMPKRLYRPRKAPRSRARLGNSDGTNIGSKSLGGDSHSAPHAFT